MVCKDETWAPRGGMALLHRSPPYSLKRSAPSRDIPALTTGPARELRPNSVDLRAADRAERSARAPRAGADECIAHQNAAAHVTLEVREAMPRRGSAAEYGREAFGLRQDSALDKFTPAAKRQIWLSLLWT
jgi:hypothetical protein